MNTLVGNRIGKYELIRLLGQGGMAEVYEAFQPGTERSVAIKVLRGYGNETPESVARFKREARSIAQLRHTNIVQVFDFDVDQNLYYMVMEYIRGGTLSEYIRARGSLPYEEALQITIQLADALAYAHRGGVIHRDIKPVNILFTDPEHKHPVLTDFGIARILGETAVTADGRFMGSPAYLSPEIALGHQADSRSDIYGLGLTLYEMMAGRMPYSASDATGIVMQHMAAPLPSVRQFNPDIPPVVEIVLSKALAKTRERRYQSADEFRAVMVRLLENISNLQTPSAGKKGGTTQIVVDNPPPDPTLTPALDHTTLPFESVQDLRTRTLPFDEPVVSVTSTVAAVEAVEKPRRRRPLFAILALLLVAAFGGYAIVNGGLALAGDNATPTQPALVVPVSSETPTTEAPTGTLTSTITATSTLTPTWTATITPTAIPSLDLPPVRENPFFSKPTAAPSETPTNTPTVRPVSTNRPVPTQGGGQGSNPTAVPPTGAPPENGGGGGNNGSGDSGGSTNPVDTVVDDVVAPVVEPVTDIIEDVLPGLPCIINCG